MKKLSFVIKYLFLAIVVMTVLGTAISAGVILYFSKDLPNIITVKDYKPLIVSKVYSKDKTLIGEYYEERRLVLPPDSIPDLVARAFVSAEDDRFFQHQGIDFQGIIRAAITNFRAGKVVQGGSTITQQVAKSLLLSPERSFVRKFKEIILANRMEKNLTKKEILYLYLNQIYLGEGSYGIEAAAETYFHKEAKDLTVAEAAILAGLPQAPSKYSPLLNPKAAKTRQLYVLRRMKEDGVITETQMEQAQKEVIKIYHKKELNLEYAPYFVEHLRKYLIDKYGKEKLYGGGIEIDTPIDAKLSKVAMRAVQEGLRNVDKKQGYRGPIKKNKNSEEMATELLEITKYNILKKYPYEILTTDGINKIQSELIKESNLTEEDLYAENEIYKALVTSVDDKKKTVEVDLGKIKATLPLEKMKWAQRVKEPSSTWLPDLVRPSQALEKGDVIWVRLLTKKAEKEQVPIVSLEQIPLVQGALLSMNTITGEVQAMVGGYDFTESEYNRAVQAPRQPGSAYKPIIYSAAIDKGYTPATIIQDSPIVFDAGENLKWKPENFEEKFYGDTTFRLALIKSRNIPTIKIVQDIELPYLIDYTKHLGINSNLPSDFSIALGSFSTSVVDLVQVYSIYPRGGRKVKAIYLNKILDREGNTLEETVLSENASMNNYNLQPFPPAIRVCGELQAEKKAMEQLSEEEKSQQLIKRGILIEDTSDPDRVIDPRTAYIMTHLMNEVATVGTGAEAKTLGRAAAGKTGTTNDSIDTWFMGFTPYVATGVWVGFDVQKSIAPKATGASVSLPIWLDYMKEAVKNTPENDFEIPKGIALVSIDGKTGKKTLPKSPDAVLEAFVEGTEPGSGSRLRPMNVTNEIESKNEDKNVKRPTVIQKNEPEDDAGDGFYKEDNR